MEIFNLLNIIALAFVGHASLLQANLAAVAPLETEETFKQLCIDEFKAKLVRDKYFLPSEADKSLKMYKELVEHRMRLGAKLGILSCPPELLENAIDQLRKIANPSSQPAHYELDDLGPERKRMSSPLDPDETFKQLCIQEYEAKQIKDNYLGIDREDELSDKYEKLTESRILLGTKLGINFCPPDVVDRIIFGNEAQKMDRIRVAFDTKCRAEVRTAVLCFRYRKARQVNTDESLNIKLMTQEQSLCQNHEFALKDRKNYVVQHMILKPCDSEQRGEAKELAKIEAQVWLDSHSALRIRLANDEPSEKASASNRNKKKDSFQSKVSNLFSCFSGSKQCLSD